MTSRVSMKSHYSSNVTGDVPIESEDHEDLESNYSQSHNTVRQSIDSHENESIKEEMERKEQEY